VPALTERYMLHGGPPIYDCRREFFRVLFWGFAVPLAAILPALWTHGFSLLLLLGYPASFAKSLRDGLRSGFGMSNALLKAQFDLCHKVANSIGLIKYFRRRLSGQVQIIEYRRPTLKEFSQ
jgi:hypothetical protein